MLRIRFFRVGKKNQPSFKIVVTDKRRPPRGGRFVEEVGFWNPLTKEKLLRAERIKYWLSVGAKLSDSVHNLLVKEKILEGKKIPLHKKKKEKKPVSAEVTAGKKEVKEEAKPEEAKQEKPKEEVAKPEEPKKEVKTQEPKEEKKEKPKEATSS